MPLVEAQAAAPMYWWQGYLRRQKRMYNPQIGRFNSMDSKAAKYNPISPYAYVANNPLIFIDPTGNEIWINYGRNQRAQYKNGRLYDMDDNEIKVDKNFDKFAGQVFSWLNEINSGDFGKLFIANLVSSETLININSTDGDSQTQSLINGETNTAISTDIYINPSKKEYAPVDYGDGETVPSVRIPKFVVLGHELGHARDDISNANKNGKWYTNEFNQTVSTGEWYGMTVENFIRNEHNLPLRTSYGTPVAPDGFELDDHSFESKPSIMFKNVSIVAFPEGQTIINYQFIARPKPSN